MNETKDAKYIYIYVYIYIGYMDKLITQPSSGMLQVISLAFEVLIRRDQIGIIPSPASSAATCADRKHALRRKIRHLGRTKCHRVTSL